MYSWRLGELSVVRHPIVKVIAKAKEYPSITFNKRTRFSYSNIHSIMTAGNSKLHTFALRVLHALGWLAWRYPRIIAAENNHFTRTQVQTSTHIQRLENSSRMRSHTYNSASALMSELWHYNAHTHTHTRSQLGHSNRMVHTTLCK